MSVPEKGKSTVKARPTHKRYGPPCTPETAPNGCGRPLPVSAVPKTVEELARLQARVERDSARLRSAAGMVVKSVEQVEIEKAVQEDLKEKAKADRALRAKLRAEAEAAEKV